MNKNSELWNERYKQLAITADYVLLERLKWTWALSPDGNAGFDTSSRIGNSRSAMDCFLGLGRFVSAFINSVHSTVKQLYKTRYTNYTLINLKSKQNE